jgi:hypothetical protein
VKTQLKVVALSVLVATSTYAQENKDMYFGLGVVQTKIGSIRDLYPGKALIAVSKAAPLAAESDDIPIASLE